MLVIIDRPDGCGFDSIVDYLNEYGVPSRIIKDLTDAKDYISSASLKDNHFFIHGSVGRSRRSFEREGYGTDMLEIVEAIHRRNEFSRITILSGMYNFPIDSTVSELKADGYVTDILRLDEVIKLAKRGEVTVEEMKERGKTIENIKSGQRVEAGIRNFKKTKEGE